MIKKLLFFSIVFNSTVGGAWTVQVTQSSVQVTVINAPESKSPVKDEKSKSYQVPDEKVFSVSGVPGFNCFVASLYDEKQKAMNDVKTLSCQLASEKGPHPTFTVKTECKAGKGSNSLQINSDFMGKKDQYYLISLKCE